MKSEIEHKVSEIIDNAFEVEECYKVPDIDDSRLTFGNKGLKFEATTLYIDMRGSTKTLNKHNRTSVAKLHMAYFHTIVKIAKSMGGEVRSFNGDGMLVFFYGTTKRSLSDAVKAAMQMKYMLTATKVHTKMDKYSSANFGIGIDHGTILCTKVGLSGANNRDLVWIGNPVNKSVKVGDKLEAPYHIGISSSTYDNLLDDVKYYVYKDAYGIERTVNMWNEGWFEYNESTTKYYYTSYHWTVS